jgi:hypothetical protein
MRDVETARDVRLVLRNDLSGNAEGLEKFLHALWHGKRLGSAACCCGVGPARIAQSKAVPHPGAVDERVQKPGVKAVAGAYDIDDLREMPGGFVT